MMKTDIIWAFRGLREWVMSSSKRKYFQEALFMTEAALRGLHFITGTDFPEGEVLCVFTYLAELVPVACLFLDVIFSF